MPRFAKLSKKARARRSAGAWAVQNMASGNFTNIATNNAADGVYTLNGEAATIGDIIDSEHAYADFDPVQDIDSEGIKARDIGGGNSSGRNLVLTSAVAAPMLANGFTCTIELLGEATFMVMADFDPSSYVQIGSSNIDYYTDADSIAGDNSFSWQADGGGEWTVPTPGQVTKLSMTFAPDYMSASLNGGPVRRFEAGAVSELYTQVIIQTGPNLTDRLRSFAIYEPVDDADLPTLSAL